jgi:hypothetical protein
MTEQDKKQEFHWSWVPPRPWRTGRHQGRNVYDANNEPVALLPSLACAKLVVDVVNVEHDQHQAELIRLRKEVQRLAVLLNEHESATFNPLEELKRIKRLIEHGFILTEQDIRLA